jgi:ubiquinone/menaquinone biosynthesis C-methylase UbiE
MKSNEISSDLIGTWTKKLYENLAQHLQVKSLVFEGKDIIEIGCGSRGAINLISGPGKRIGIDPFIEEFRSRGCLLELDHVQLFSEMAERLSFPSDSFDFAICFNTLDHVKNPREVLKQVHRVLKPSGLLLLNVHAFNLYSTKLFAWFLRFADPTHPHHFSSKAIVGMLSHSGFKVDIAKVQPLGLNYRNIIFRTLANLIGRTLWVKARKEV